MAKAVHLSKTKRLSLSSLQPMMMSKIPTKRSEVKAPFSNSTESCCLAEALRILR